MASPSRWIYTEIMLTPETVNFSRNVPTCHKCPRRCGNDCTVTNRPIGELAESYACPEFRFKARGAGDTLGRALFLAEIGPVAAKAIQAASGGKPCGCAERAAALNRLVPYG